MQTLPLVTQGVFSNTVHNMNINSYFTQYQSPNIVIVPTLDCSPPVKLQKMENNIVVPIVDDATFNKQKLIQKSDQSKAMHDAKNETTEKLTVHSPSTVKKASWATNYLQSIGLVQKSSIWHHKIPRKNISQSANICINTTGVQKSHLDNAAIDKSNNLKENKQLNNTIKINDKPYSGTKNVLSPQETVKKTKQERDCFKDKRLRNETIRSVVVKKVKDLKSGENTVTALNDKKKRSTNSMIPNDDKTNRVYLKQRTNSYVNNNINVKSNILCNQSEKEFATALNKNKNSKFIAEQFKQFKNSKRDRYNTDKKLSLKTKESVTDTTRERKSKRRKYTSSSDLRHDVKKTLQKHQSTKGEITSVKKILKVTKKYDINDLNRLNETKNNKLSTCTKQRISKTCKKEELRKSTKVISPRDEINLETSSSKRKQISNSPIKKKAHNTKSYRKIKLVINVICNESSSRHCNNNNIEDSRKECTASNVELDFLNDFNIDEIVESLDKCDRETSTRNNESLSLQMKLNHDVNSSSISMINNNTQTDATDLLKILKGEDDDFITQSIENTNDLLFGCKFHNIQNTEPYNEIRNIIRDNNSDMSKKSTEIPINIKEELLDIFSESDQNNLFKNKISIRKKQTENNICESNFEISNPIQDSNGGMSKKSIELPIKIKEEMLDMFSESEQNNLHQKEIGEAKLTENIICERTYEPINLENENNFVTSNFRDNCSDVKKNPLATSVKTSEQSILHVNNTKNEDVMAQEITNESTICNSCSRYVRNPIPEESNVEAKEKLIMYNSNFAPKTQVYQNTNKHYEIRVNDKSKEIKVEDEKTKSSEFQNVVKYKNNEKNIAKYNERLTKEKYSETFKNLEAHADFSDNTITNIKSKDDKTLKETNNNNTILIDQGNELKIVDNIKKVVLHSKTEESACPKNDKNSRKDLCNIKDIVSSQLINTGDKKGKHEIEEKCFVDKSKEPLNPEKQDSNMPSCSKISNLEHDVNNENNLNKKSLDVQHLPNKPSTSVSIKKDTDDLEVALSSPTFKVNETLAKQLQENIFKSLKIKYSITSLLHQGQFSTIFKCKHPNGKNYALKILANSKQCMETKKEMWMSLQHYIPRKNVFTVYLANAFKFEAKWYILMDYYPKNLAQVLKEADKTFCVETIQEYARQLVTAVMFLRNNNMIHSDIKPRHILLNSSNNIVKLCGLDRLCYVNKLPVLPNVGSVNYRAPEVILGYPAGFEIDVWSTGVVLFEIATQQKLFPGTYNNDILYKQICTLGYVPYDMISKCRFASHHFRGTKFMRRMGPAGKEIHLIKKFMKNNKLSYGIFNAYYNNWSCFRTNTELTDDLEKLRMFVNLLQKMLVIHPRHRLSIEFVYGNQFIYDAYKYNEW